MPQEFNFYYVLALGSNLGDKAGHIRLAIERLVASGNIVIEETGLMETEPAMVKAQPDFINKGILIHSLKNPEELYGQIKEIETFIGRQKTYRYGPREIDIDIVWWSAGEYRSQLLQIPHVWNFARPWVRQILAELVPAQSGQKSFYQIMNVKSIQNIHDFKKKKIAGEKIAVLTVYDYSMAKILAKSSLDVLLVGDTLATVVQGEENTLKAKVRDMIYHGRIVRKAAPDKFLVVDMPFLSYQVSPESALMNAGKIIRETGADGVKLEGGRDYEGAIKKIIKAGIPVMGHLGLMPQSVLSTGGHKLQAKNSEEKKRVVEEALFLQDLGIFALVAEMVPADLGLQLSEALEIPVIGIGAGPGVDGQVLVINDMLGFNPDFNPKFLRKYMDAHEQVLKAVENFSHDVRSKNYPSEEEFFGGS